VLILISTPCQVIRALVSSHPVPKWHDVLRDHSLKRWGRAAAAPRRSPPPAKNKVWDEAHDGIILNIKPIYSYSRAWAKSLSKSSMLNNWFNKVMTKPII